MAFVLDDLPQMAHAFCRACLAHGSGMHSVVQVSRMKADAMPQGFKLELIEKLAALVPSPRLNLIRYHGVLAPNAAARAAIVPGPQAEADVQTCSRHGVQGQPSTYRRSWATLLARVFRIDVTHCPDCGGPMRIIAALTDPGSIRRCLQGMGLPARAPPIAPARPEPQAEFDYV